MAGCLERDTARILLKISKSFRKETVSVRKRYIMTTRPRVDRVLEDLQKNPYFTKYAKKIAQFQQTNPEEFSQRVEKAANNVEEKKEKCERERNLYQSQAKPCLEPGMHTKKNQLKDIMKLDMIQDKSKEEIIQIWQEYHKKKDCISGIMTPEQFDKMFERGKKFSTFLLPLPREHGYEFIVVQFHGMDIHMAPLLWYQTHKENAPECLTMIHYDELRDSKGIVLMRGEFDIKFISAQEAQCLANELQLYYSTDNTQRYQLLETFTEKPDEFKHMDLITQLETISLNASVTSIYDRVQQRSSWLYSIILPNERTSQVRHIKRCYSDYTSKNVYITTPIFYVNAGPHIGHLYSAIMADTFARYNSMLGHTVFLNTGTDEHGKKVQNAADHAKLPVAQYCTEISHQFKEMCDTFDVSYSNFIRTTEQRHHEAVQHFWNILMQKNHIYLGKYTGWYCVSDEAFVGDNELSEKTDSAGNKIKVSADSGNPVEWTEENNYMFRLSSFQDDLKHWLKHENAVRPAKFHKILSDMVHDDTCISDLSISRPAHRSSWGIPTPVDESQCIYVWFDALLNYLTSLGYPNSSFKQFWPPTIQVIGKDILKFHGLFWPAFLIAAGLDPPETLLCHSHWTIDAQKMSKSKGNIVTPNEAANKFTKDGLRYFLLREAVPYNDANYSEVKIYNILNSQLADTLGNLISRCTGKIINPWGEVPDPCQYVKLLQSAVSHKNMNNLESISKISQECYENYNLHQLVDSVISMLHSANEMVEYHKPWQLAKNLDDPNSANELKAVISLALETARVAALILHPIVPGLTNKLLDVLMVPRESRTWTDTTPMYLRDQERVSRQIKRSDGVLFKRLRK